MAGIQTNSLSLINSLKQFDKIKASEHCCQCAFLSIEFRTQKQVVRPTAMCKSVERFPFFQQINLMEKLSAF
jgi:hypothetical protein